MPLASRNNLELDYLRPEDANEAGRLNVTAFHIYPYFQHMMPATEATYNGWKNSTLAALKDPLTIALKVTDSSTGRMVATGRWVQPYPQGATIQSAVAQPGHEEWRWTDDFMQACDEELATTIFGAFERNRDKFMGLTRHWYMELLVTDPKYKGQGAGSLIIQHGLALADAEKMPCYIDASPEGKPLYEKFGWDLSYAEDFKHDMRYYFGPRAVQNS